jgi:hypothetical protein
VQQVLLCALSIHRPPGIKGVCGIVIGGLFYSKKAEAGRLPPSGNEGFEGNFNFIVFKNIVLVPVVAYKDAKFP